MTWRDLNVTIVCEALDHERVLESLARKPVLKLPSQTAYIAATLGGRVWTNWKARAMSVFVQKASGRLALLIIAAATVLVLLTSLLVSGANAATVTVWDEGIPLAEGESVCEAQDYGPAFSEFIVPRGKAVPRFDETYVDGDITVRLTAPPNRSRVEFTVTGAKVFGGFLFNRTDGTGGVTEHNYQTEGASEGTLVPPSRDNGNEKLVVLCFGKATPTMSTLATESAAAGDVIFDKATIASEEDPTGGFVRFTLYSDDQCSPNSVIWTSDLVEVTYDSGEEIYTATVSTPGEAESDHLDLATGAYYWIARYEGNANNNPVEGECQDEGEVTTVYDVQFFCGVTWVAPNAPEGIEASFTRPLDTTGCAENTEKYGSVSFGTLTTGENVVQFIPSGPEDAYADFVGQIRFDTTGATAWPILRIDDTEDSIDIFENMEWWVVSDPVSDPVPSFEFDQSGNLIAADFACGSETWCILSAVIDPTSIIWYLGGEGVDPKWAF